MIVLSAGLLSALPASGETVVTVPNSDFENPDTAGQAFEYSLTADWNFQTTNNSTFRWIDINAAGRADSDVHSGNRAYRITSPNTGGQAYIQQNSSARFAAVAGKTYTVNFWAKGLNLDLSYDSVRVSIEWWNAGGTEVVGTWNSRTQLFSDNDSWEQISFSSTAAPAGAATGKILIFFMRGALSVASEPSITLDDISVD
ncbi:MAG: carbohydrate binding domain-containing protein [Terrimicrobiaceae bacterium]